MTKVEAIAKLPIPTNKKELLRFLGMAGFYRKFCPNFSAVNPITTLLQKRVTLNGQKTAKNRFIK